MLGRVKHSLRAPRHSRQGVGDADLTQTHLGYIPHTRALLLGCAFPHPSVVFPFFHPVSIAPAWVMGGRIGPMTFPSLNIPPIYVSSSLYITLKKNYSIWLRLTCVSAGQWFLFMFAHTKSRGVDRPASDIGRQEHAQETVNGYYITWNVS